MIIPDNKIIPVILFTVVLSVLFSGCYPDEADNPEDMELVTAEHDVNYSFVSNRTYIMPDTVMHIIDLNDPGNYQQINTGSDELILGEVAGHLDALGFKRVIDTQGERPDVYVTISAISALYLLNDDDDWWYYWKYYRYWPIPWVDEYYPWYPWGKPVYYGYTIGTVIIRMMDGHSAADDKIPVVWNVTLNGLLQDTVQNLDQRVERDIDQAFELSTYLND